MNVERWMALMDRLSIMRDSSHDVGVGKVYIIREHVTIGGMFEEETAIIESRGLYLHATPLRFDITFTRETRLRDEFAVNLKEEFMYKRNFTVLSV